MQNPADLDYIDCILQSFNDSNQSKDAFEKVSKLRNAASELFAEAVET